MKLTRGAIALKKAEAIELQRKKGAAIPPFAKHHSRGCSCVCSICGNALGRLTFAHAEKHGFETPEKMINAGMVRWL